MTTISAFVLDKKVKTCRALDNPNAVYDHTKQIWMDKATDTPLVLSMINYAHRRSPFGETTLTESGEGTDVSEVINDSLHLSPFGETHQTRAECEGTDVDPRHFASPFGETAHTFSDEGTDISSGLGPTLFGETSFTKTFEGTDQSSETC